MPLASDRWWIDALQTRVSQPPPDLIDDAFWLLLGRSPSPHERRDERRAANLHALLLRLLVSPEFARVRSAWQADRAPYTNPTAVENALLHRGSNERFVARAYECLLGRAADEVGLRHYSTALQLGDSRSSVLKALARSVEFEDRYRNLAPQNGVVPFDIQLCELANPAKWDNPDWTDILRDLGLSVDKLSMHRKPYEFAQLVFGCRQLGVLQQTASVLSVGAGHELILYWLANHVRHVIATDLYEGVWTSVQGREGDPNVLRQPEAYAPFDYRRDHLRFLQMDGRHLAFRDGVFDIVYSLSSIEHFGGLPGAISTIREMRRVLTPGGILVLATEYVLSGPAHEETFLPEEVADLIDQPGLELVAPLDDRVYDRYDYAAVDLYRNPYQSPHMVVRFNDTIFTTVMLFLRRV